MEKRIHNIIYNHWDQMINNSYFYRGMSIKNLSLKSPYILDPNKNPLENLKPLLIKYSALLFKLIEKGLEFNVNDFYVEPLQKILIWTLRDLRTHGIDFTTYYAGAASYAFNYAGSQVKHNFKIITETIHECENQPCFNKLEKQNFLILTKKIKLLLAFENKLGHQPAVIKVKKSCTAFQNEKTKNLNFGSYDYFFAQVKKRAQEKKAFNLEKIAFFLQEEAQKDCFNVKLINPLRKKDVEAIIRL